MNDIAISIRQPWAWLIVEGWKGEENRTWKTDFRGRVLIHAGKTMTRADYEACTIFVASISDDLPIGFDLPSFEKLRDECGGIVGEVVITDCVARSESPWFVGPYAFVMRNARRVPFQRCRGLLGFFKPWVGGAATEGAKVAALNLGV